MLEEKEKLSKNPSKNKKSDRLYAISIITVLAVCVFLICTTGAVIGITVAAIRTNYSHKLNYVVGNTVAYDITSTIQNRDESTIDPQYHVEIDGKLLVRCIKDDKIHSSFVFELNLFNVTFYNVTLDGKVKIQYVNDTFGFSIYFNQSYNGTINKIIRGINMEEDAFAIKLAALRAFQVLIDGGKHLFMGVNGRFNAHSIVQYGKDWIKKIFRRVTDDDYIDFTDDTLDNMVKERRRRRSMNDEDEDESKMFSSSSDVTHEIGPNGRIIKVTQLDTTRLNNEHPDEFEEDGEGSVVSIGYLEITVDDEYVLPKEEDLWDYALEDYDQMLVRRRAMGDLTKEDRRELQDLFVEGDLFEIGDYLVGEINRLSFWDNIPELLNSYFQKFVDAIENSEEYKEILEIIDMVVYFLKHVPELFESLILPYLTTKITEKLPVELIDEIFYLCARVDTPESQAALILFGLNNLNSTFRFIAVLSCRNIDTPIIPLIDKLKSISMTDLDEEIKTSAFLVYSELLVKLDDDRRSVNELISLLPNDDLTDSQILTILYGFQNSEVVIESEEIFDFLASRNNEYLWEAAKSVLAPRFHRRSVNNVNAKVFTWSKGKTYDKKVGGSKFSATFHGKYELKASSDCQGDMRYKVLGEVWADGKVLGKSKRLIDAHAIYDRQGDMVLGNDIKLTVYGKTIYHNAFPTSGCTEKTKNLFHTAKGFKVDYHVMVGPVPVTFGVSAEVKVDMDFYYKFCLASVEARAKLMPKISFVGSGHASVDVIAVKGGAKAEAELNAQLIPEAYISGGECKAGAKVDLVINPFDMHFYVYYKTRKCKIGRREYEEQEKQEFHLHVKKHFKKAVHGIKKVIKKIPKISCPWGKEHKKDLFKYHQKSHKTIYENNEWFF